MRRIVLVLATAVATSAGCSVTDPPEPDADAFEFEPGMFVPRTWDAAGKADLPNSAFTPAYLDTSGYLAIAQQFQLAGYDVTPTAAQRAFDWPLEPADQATVLNRAGTPIRLARRVYEHTGFDIIRHDAAASTEVFAPVGGIAEVTDWNGQQQLFGGYQSVVSIWDPETHLIVQLMHVEAAPELPRDRLFTIERGQRLGVLGAIEIRGGQHTHVNVVDASARRLVDPALLFPTYLDTTAPVIEGVYLLDEAAASHRTLTTGALDVVVEVSDRDDRSPRNLEPARIAYVARAQDGTVLGQVGGCALADAFADLELAGLTSAIRLLDFGNAAAQVGGFWPSSDLGNPDRTFRYAVTNLRLDGDRCAVTADDRLGAIVVTDEVTSVQLSIDVWDAHGNHTAVTRTLTR